MRSPSPDASSSRWVLALIALAAFAWTAARSSGYLIDDTFIALRYARNLVEGNGLVFNPGEAVEGYTSLAWALVSALLLAVRIDPVAGLVVVSGASAVAAVLLTAHLEREVAGAEAPRPAVSVLLLVSASAFAYWSARALETLLFTAILLGAIALSLRESKTGRWRGSGLAFGALALTRPEAPLLFGVFTAGLAVAERWRRGSWGALPRHAANALVVATVLAGHLAWRWHTYGELLPNTFYAKLTGGTGQLATGLRYLREFSLAFPIFAATLAFPAALASKSARARLAAPELGLALYATFVAWVAYVVAAGADFMPYFRFFVPVLPLAAVLAAAALRGAPRLASARVLLALVSLHAAAGLATEQPYRAFVAHRTARVGERVGAWLAQRLAPGDWIAVNTAGSLPYASRLPTIDMLGLTDAQIARRPIYIVSEGWAGHRRGWGEYVLERRPRVVFWYNSAGLAEPHYLSDHELADDPRFRFFYALRAETLPPEPGVNPEAVIRRFLGFPFGFDASGASAIPDLGLRLAFQSDPVRLTRFFEGPIRVVTFELDARDLELWEAGMRARGEPRSLVEAAAARWAAQPAPPADPVARAEVEARCAEALSALEARDAERAKRILAEAAPRNRAARSPLLPQYVANLAVLSGDLFQAVAAQKEALRLDPGNALYRENLVRLLGVPWAKASRAAAHSE